MSFIYSDRNDYELEDNLTTECRNPECKSLNDSIVDYCEMCGDDLHCDKCVSCGERCEQGAGNCDMCVAASLPPSNCGREETPSGRWAD